MTVLKKFLHRNIKGPIDLVLKWGTKYIHLNLSPSQNSTESTKGDFLKKKKNIYPQEQGEQKKNGNSDKEE